MNEKKKWDVAFVREIRLLIEASTKEEARARAEEMKDSNERIGIIHEAK